MIRIRETKSFDGHAEHRNKHGAGTDFMNIDDDLSSLAFHENIVWEDRKEKKTRDLNTSKDEPESRALFFESKVIAEHNDGNY